MNKTLILFFSIILLNSTANSADPTFITKKQFLDSNIKKLEQQFDEIDTNKDGKMTEAEEKAYIKKVQEIRQIRQNLLQLADTNKDGKIDRAFIVGRLHNLTEFFHKDERSTINYGPSVYVFLNNN